MSTQMVEISTERLRQLEELEASLPKRIEEALKEYKTAALRRLHEKDKQNPQAVNERAKRYAQKHSEELNAKRREKRRLAKIAKESASNLITVVRNSSNANNTIKITNTHKTMNTLTYTSEVPTNSISNSDNSKTVYF